MACPKCGCKETYAYVEDDFLGLPDDQERCAACGHIFFFEDGTDEDEEFDMSYELRMATLENARNKAEDDYFHSRPFLLNAPKVFGAGFDRGWEASLTQYAFQKLGARLTELLDEDQWAECEALLLAAGVTPNADSTTPPVA